MSIKKNKKIDSCKPFIASSILFLLVSVTIAGIFIYFYINRGQEKICHFKYNSSFFKM